MFLLDSHEKEESDEFLTVREEMNFLSSLI